MRIIAGKARRLPLKTVPGLDTRPTSDRIKETLFNILQADIPDCRFLDLFSGSGAIAIEALSRGAAYAVLVEQSREAAECMRENLNFTKTADRAELIKSDALTALRRMEAFQRQGVVHFRASGGSCQTDGGEHRGERTESHL